MSSKTRLTPFTVRLPEADAARLRAEAEELGVSVAVLLRILVRQSLRGGRSVVGPPAGTPGGGTRDLLGAAGAAALDEDEVAAVRRAGVRDDA
ncbi:MAG: ribbon-helix-helix protein, CopG family [Trueperaceae bacterium]|nr:ribbon-helix-helix protein, CopG family [Trueperaceae bacterium]